MKNIEKIIHIIVWSLLLALVSHQFWETAQPIWLFFNQYDVIVFGVACIVLPFVYRMIKSQMFGGYAIFSRRGLEVFLTLDEGALQQKHFPNWLTGGDAKLDKIVVIWSYSFVLFFATGIDFYRQWLVYQHGSIATQKFLIGMLFVGIASFVAAWLFRLPSSKR